MLAHLEAMLAYLEGNVGSTWGKRLRLCHGQGAPGRTKGLRPLPPTPVVLGLFCIMLDKFHKDRMPDVAF